MTMLRLAVGLAGNRAVEHRWRRVALPASALIFMVLLLVATSVFMMFIHEGEREAERRALLSTEPASTDLLMIPRLDIWQDQTISVVWMEPVSPATEAVLPPGVTALPAAGQAVVSPALDRLIGQHPELALRYPDRMLLEPDGVRSGGELFAYIRMPADRHLNADEAYQIRDGTGFGHGPAYRISGFGSPAGGLGPTWGAAELDVPAGAVVTGLLTVLVLPAIIVLTVGCAAASELRDRRFELLRAIGAGPRKLTTLAVLETLLLAVPGFLLAVVLWGIVGGRLEVVPIVGYEVVAGDLGLSWWLLLSLVGVASILTMVVAVVVAMIVGRRQTAPRPVTRRPSYSVYRVVLLAGTLAAFTYGRAYGGSSAEDFYLLGVILAVIGMTLIVPWVLNVAGRIVSRFRPITLAVVGRSMEWDPTRAARPFVGAAALLVLVLTSTGYITLGRYTEEGHAPTGDAQAVTVEWQSPQPDDLGRFRSAMGTGLTAPLAEGDYLHRHIDGSDHQHEADTGLLSIGANCLQVAPYFSGTCDDMSPLDISPEVQRQLAERLAPFSHGPVRQVRLVPPQELDGMSSLLILDMATLETIDAAARTAAMATLPAPNIHSLYAAEKRESPLVQWIIAGTTAAVSVLALACLLALVDRLLSSRHHHRRLLHLGISKRRVSALAAWGFLLPYSVVLAASLIVGLVACALLVMPVTAMPWTPVVATLVVSVLVGAVGTVSMASFAVKDIVKERE